jgi:hypothetical protein
LRSSKAAQPPWFAVLRWRILMIVNRSCASTVGGYGVAGAAPSLL